MSILTNSKPSSNASPFALSSNAETTADSILELSCLTGVPIPSKCPLPASVYNDGIAGLLSQLTSHTDWSETFQNRLHEIKSQKSKEHTYPRVPKDMKIKPKSPTSQQKILAKLEEIQQYISSLGYNHLPITFFPLKKGRSLKSHSETARQIIALSLPIRCLEAVIVGIYLTHHIPDLLRIPVSFKSKSLANESHMDRAESVENRKNKNIFRHIVMAVRIGDRWGALGLSRRQDLMNKDATFESLTELLKDYERCYDRNKHKLAKITIGLPITHDPFSTETIHWKYLSLSINQQSWAEINVQVDKLNKLIRSKDKFGWELLLKGRSGQTRDSDDNLFNKSDTEALEDTHSENINKMTDSENNQKLRLSGHGI
ncbi:Vasohibin-domain-containing protein [Paraphysoderma sedebokerense]|nr:Vasohibin-domain-containing protein [Paraphysoderma sedebokerense]